MRSALVLNATYEPLSIVPARRAACLVLAEKAEIVHDDGTELHSARLSIPSPTVIRLRRYINVPRRGVRWSRKAVLQRDQYTCAYCGIQPGQPQRRQVLTRQNFTVDHILPISRGGKNTWGNTVCACPLCNQRKGNRTPHEANMKLRWEPKTPRVNYVVASGEIPAIWKIYLEI
jgi:5-methylcytosine-specific restriction endonuclease McrA